MKYRLTQENLLKYTIKDENEKTIYTCEKQLLSLSSKYLIFDENKLRLAEVKATPFAKTEYKLYTGGAMVDDVVISQRVPLEKYILPHKKWTISGDITYTKYEVKNENQDLILVMDLNLAEEPYVWNITINTKEQLLAIMVVVTIMSIAKK